MTARQPGAIVIRRATDADICALVDLAILDSRGPLTGPALIAEVDDVARAALDTADGSVAADPFAPTAELVELLRLHARSIGSAHAGHGSLRGRVATLVRAVSVRAAPVPHGARGRRRAAHDEIGASHPRASPGRTANARSTSGGARSTASSRRSVRATRC